MFLPGMLPMPQAMTTLDEAVVSRLGSASEAGRPVSSPRCAAWTAPPRPEKAHGDRGPATYCQYGTSQMAVAITVISIH